MQTVSFSEKKNYKSLWIWLRHFKTTTSKQNAPTCPVTCMLWNFGIRLYDKHVPKLSIRFIIRVANKYPNGWIICLLHHWRRLEKCKANLSRWLGRDPSPCFNILDFKKMFRVCFNMCIVCVRIQGTMVTFFPKNVFRNDDFFLFLFVFFDAGKPK